MTAGRNDRRPVRTRHRGRHAAPTQVEKVAQQATKAAPAVAIAGALIAAPQSSHALAASANPVPVTAQSPAAHAGTAKNASTSSTRSVRLDSGATHIVGVTGTKLARHAARTTSTTYRVRAGDTLSKIANAYFHNDDWQYLYHVNDKTISDPNVLSVGQKLSIPASAPAHYELSGYEARHAKPAGSATATTTAVVQSAPQARYSCSGLEQLWEQAGGNAADALMAAEIAMAESGGNPNAESPTADFGLWQINASHGALATLNPFGNAQSAVILSGNGTNWGPWTTYHSGAYVGKC